MSKTCKLFIFIAFLVLAIGVVGYGVLRDRRLTSVFGGSQAIKTVKNATSVKAFRLPSPSEYRQSLSDYETTAGPINVSDGAVSKLQSALLNQSSYGWNYAKGCMPDYGVRIQFLHAGDAVDVLLCFGCDILVVYHNGKAVGGEDFDNARTQLVAVVKELFPEDDAIQSLE